MRATRVAILALCLAVQPVRADIIIPSDFTVTNGWGFRGCQFGGARICVEGLAFYGQSATTGLFGVTYAFWTNIYDPLPPSTILQAGMRQIEFQSVEDPSVFVLLGDYPRGPGPSLTSGQFYSPLLTAHATIFSNQAYWSAYSTAGGGPPVFVGEAYGPIGVSPTPEPGSLALLATGMLVVGVVARRRPTVQRRLAVCARGN